MLFLKQLFQGKGGVADEMAVLTVMGVLTFLGLAIYSVVWKGQPFEPQNYGTGLGLVVIAALVGFGLRSKLGGD